jgi:hypothetical protein
VAVDVKHFNVALPHGFTAKDFMHWHRCPVHRSALVQLLNRHLDLR